MRTIKFRIWNGREMEYNITSGKFGTFYVNPEKGDGLNPQDTASLTVNTTKYHESTPVMQFTGLTDCDGLEVYELDIVENDAAVWEVVFNRGCFCGKAIGDVERDTYMALRAIRGFKLIGNKFSNPSLLNPDK